MLCSRSLPPCECVCACRSFTSSFCFILLPCHIFYCDDNSGSDGRNGDGGKTTVPVIHVHFRALYKYNRYLNNNGISYKIYFKMRILFFILDSIFVLNFDGIVCFHEFCAVDQWRERRFFLFQCECMELTVILLFYAFSFDWILPSVMDSGPHSHTHKFSKHICILTTGSIRNI